MLILKYSYLDEAKQLVKVLSRGKYGILSFIHAKVIAEPVFDYLHFNTHDKTIWAKMGCYYFAIDQYGNILNEEPISAQRWAYIDKNDRCPSCAGECCNQCYGFGFIPIGGDFTPYFMID